MEIRDNKQGTKLTVTIIGTLNTMTSPTLGDYISQNLNGIEELIFDFSELEYITSSGLRVLLQAQKIMNRQGKMSVTHVNKSIREVFELTGFLDILTITD